jgi:hypothetical protein
MGGGSATSKTASYTLVAADAGTTVIMNSASSTTITVNTALFAAGDTVLIVNQGAGVCTVTAGTATVNTAGALALSQYETGQLYFLSASAAIFTEYTQTGLTLISTVSTGGAVTAINFGSNAAPIFSSTYDNYKIIFVGTSSVSLNPLMRMRADTTNATAANYSYQLNEVSGTSVTAARSTAQTSIALSPLGTGVVGIQIDLYSPFLAQATTLFSAGPSQISTISFQTFAGVHSLATSYNGFGILTGSAATIDGIFSIYGVAK